MFSQHVDYQSPNEHYREYFSIDLIENNDLELHAALANVRKDKGPNGLKTDFEKAVAHILPMDPVQKSKAISDKRSP